MRPELEKEIVEELYRYLGVAGLDFFQKVKSEFGNVSAVLPRGHVLNPYGNFAPFPIHFNEGMQIRNFVRTKFTDEKFDSEQLDNNWGKWVEAALDYIPPLTENTNRLTTID